MQHDIPWLLLEKYFAKQTNDLENRQIKEWLESAAENSMILEQLQSFYHEIGSLPVEFTPDTQKALKKISTTVSFPKAKSRSSAWWKVAAALLVMIAGWWFTRHVEKEKAPVYSSVTTTTKNIDTLALADGSRIWLNAGSEIKYPAKFGKTREIYLKGEAYFEIANDPRHPFIVHTGNTKTRVLGTKFNIRSFSHENLISVTVNQGKVVFGITPGKEVFLTRGTKGVYDRQTGQITQSANTDPNYLAWKTRQLIFDSQSLETVFKTLSGVYHFTYRFENSHITKRRLTAMFNQRPLNEILETISVSAEINVTSRDSVFYIH